jgi:hypothetical protein
VATFPTLPGLLITCHRRPIFSTGIQTSASGKEMRASWWSTPRYEYDLTFEILREDATYTEVSTLLAFIAARLGSFDSFTFVDPYDGTNVTCRFKQDSFDFARIVDKKWELRTLTLISLK